jgi:TatD DNase family protein
VRLPHCEYVDFHCHLDLFDHPKEAVERAASSGVYTLLVTTTPSAWRGTCDLAGGARRIRIGLGLHPELAHERMHELELFREILPQAQYVGEIGLDGAPHCKAHFRTQQSVFSAILQAVTDAGGRILSLHSRRAVSEVLDTLSSFPSSGVAVMHWFTGTRAQLKRAIDLGCWFSVGPGMLRTDAGRERIKCMPLDRILTETDGPFVMQGGSSAGPWDIPAIVQKLADTVCIREDELAHLIAGNFRRLVASSGSE